MGAYTLKKDTYHDSVPSKAPKPFIPPWRATHLNPDVAAEYPEVCEKLS